MAESGGSGQPAEEASPVHGHTTSHGGRRLLRRLIRVALAIALGTTLLATMASFAYNAATGSFPARPAGLHMIDAGGIDTRYRSWGTAGSPVVLVPGAFETADTFARLGSALGRDHRVFALDLTGTGYSKPIGPFDAGHLADQVLAFTKALELTGAAAPVLVGHSSGAAVVGVAALRGGSAIAGIMFLDGDATPLHVPWFVGSLLINPFRTTVLRFALRSDWLIRTVYDSQCGPGCPKLEAAGVGLWRLPLQQPGFGGTVSYMLNHGIPSMTSTELDQLRLSGVRKSVVFGADDPQFSRATPPAVAARIGAPPPTLVPGRHLTMISSPNQVAEAVRALIKTETQVR